MNQRIARVLEVVGERGYVSTEDLMQLIDCEVPIYERLAGKLGATPAEVKRMAERREVEPETLRAVLA